MTGPSLPPAVVDTTILIDMYVGGLLREFFRLPLRLLTADVLLAELQEPAGSTVAKLGLESAELSGTQVAAVIDILSRQRQVSANDVFALVLARELRALLLTGDRHLARLAVEMGLQVHGTLWALDSMVRLMIVTAAQASQSLEQMCLAGRRLPAAECRARLQRWKGER